MTTILTIVVVLIVARLLVRSAPAVLPILAVVGLIALAISSGNGGTLSALAGPLLLLVIMLVGFWTMLRGLFR